MSSLIAAVPKTRGSSPASQKNARYFSRSHPLAEPAGRLCAQSHKKGPVDLLIGSVACGACWEQAIRIDERFVIDNGVERTIIPDPTYVDPIAVERALKSEKVRLTNAEQIAVACRLSRSEAAPNRLVHDLRTGISTDTAPQDLGVAA